MTDSADLKGRKPVMLSLSPRWNQELTRLAKQNGMNRSGYVRQLLREAIIDERKHTAFFKDPAAPVVVKVGAGLYAVEIGGREFTLERLGDHHPLSPVSRPEAERMYVQNSVVHVRPNGARYLIVMGEVDADDVLWFHEKAVISAGMIEAGQAIDVEMDD